MTNDPLDIARARREALKAEITHLDAFIRMGEKLVRESQALDIPAMMKGLDTRTDPAQA